MSVLILTIVSLILILCSALDTVNVTTSLGTVIGLHVINNNIEYYSFKGIPYANVTERFKAPTPMTPWQSAVLAFNDGPICPQPRIPSMPDSEQSEDCLSLNIYTPQLPQADHPKLPVMVLIHGGGFFLGTGGSLMFGPEFFMAEKEVIIVAINYRLGLLGFLSTGTEDAQGNAGMKDQVEALKWVKQEITHFGGDPTHVTIFGQSAGSAAVVLHMASPMSKGLFHGVIAQSGAALADWANIEASLACRRATRIAELLYCNTKNTTTIVNCLKKMSTSAITQAIIDLAKEEDVLIVMSPVIETGKFLEDAFLPDAPSKLFDNLDVSSSVPLIIGTTKDEGMMMLSLDDNIYVSMDRNLQTFIPFSVRKQLTAEQIGILTQRLRQYYFNGGPVTPATNKGFVDVAKNQSKPVQDSCNPSTSNASLADFCMGLVETVCDNTQDYPKNDTGHFIGKSIISNVDKEMLIPKVWEPSMLHKCFVQIIGSKKRTCQVKWPQRFSWLAYSDKLKGAFCKYSNTPELRDRWDQQRVFIY